MDMVRSMMSHVSLPLTFWGYPLETATYTLNRVPTKAIDKTPYELWFGKKPNLSYLKIWGCDAYVKSGFSDKLATRSIKCTFVGYPKETKGYYFYLPSEHKVFIARYATFLEREFISKESSGSKVDLGEIEDSTNELEHEQLDVEQTPQGLVVP